MDRFFHGWLGCAYVKKLAQCLVWLARVLKYDLIECRFVIPFLLKGFQRDEAEFREPLISVDIGQGGNAALHDLWQRFLRDRGIEMFGG
ncbi:hypothetical protein D3C79_558200 [compost metagenome]